jgi:hypothetical protein
LSSFFFFSFFLLLFLLVIFFVDLAFPFCKLCEGVYYYYNSYSF